jgi:hypothetical protein
MQTTNSAYSGPERRRRRVYVTQNSEYHCKDGICIAVRDARTGDFVPTHAVLGKRMTGAFVLTGGGGIASVSPPENAIPGQRAHFSADADDRRDVVTSSLRSIERPSRAVVAQYEAAIR